MAYRDLSRGLTFDIVAQEYDRFRPRYPSALFDDLADVARLSTQSRILEVGSGPGVATEEMVARGWSVLGIDPGAHLARVALGKFSGQRFAVEVSTFDDWDPRGRRFDLLVSATAYHWVAPEVRWTKAAAVLEEGGVIALITNEVDDRGTFHDFVVATSQLRASHGVDEEEENTAERLESVISSAGGDIGGLWEALSPQGSAVRAGDLFAAPDVRLYRWSRSYSISEALGLLATYSRFLVLEAPRRAALFDQLAAVADSQFAGRLRRHYVTVLATARRSDYG